MTTVDSRQVRDSVGQIDGLAGRFELTRLDDSDLEHITLMDTAAVMMNLDLVVTCDTVTAHLAGRPVSSLYRFVNR